MMRIILLMVWFYCLNTYAAANRPNPFQHPFYVGVLGGYGSTTWDGLVPTEENQNIALSLSTPLMVREGGGVWGLFAGYEFIPFFAIETSYMHYPAATITFDP